MSSAVKDEKIRLGGQAFGGGVLIRSRNHWALAREDGRLFFGSTTSWLDHHPKFNLFFFRSLIALWEMLRFTLGMVKQTGGRENRRLLKWLLIYLVIALPLAYFFEAPTEYALGRIVFEVFSFALAIWLMSRALSPKIWSYHGAEHKAVNAFEQGVDLEKIDEVMACSRMHDRCGSNLAVLIALISLIFMPAGGSVTAVLISTTYNVIAIGMAVELFRYLTRFPTSWLTRVVLFSGRQLQKFVTTKEPSSEQLKLAVRAVKTVLALEAMRAHAPAADVS